MSDAGQRTLLAAGLALSALLLPRVAGAGHSVFRDMNDTLTALAAFALGFGLAWLMGALLSRRRTACATACGVLRSDPGAPLTPSAR